MICLWPPTDTLVYSIHVELHGGPGVGICFEHKRAVKMKMPQCVPAPFMQHTVFLTLHAVYKESLCPFEGSAVTALHEIWSLTVSSCVSYSRHNSMEHYRLPPSRARGKTLSSHQPAWVLLLLPVMQHEGPHRVILLDALHLGTAGILFLLFTLYYVAFVLYIETIFNCSCKYAYSCIVYMWRKSTW